MFEAALIRRQLCDAEWYELLQSRPNLGDALAAHDRT